MVCVPPGFSTATTIADGGEPTNGDQLDEPVPSGGGGGCSLGGPQRSGASKLVALLSVLSGLALVRRRRRA